LRVVCGLFRSHHLTFKETPYGQWLAAGGLETASLWDVETGMPAQTLALAACNALTFSPDGRWLVCQSLSRPVLTVWNIMTFK